MTSFPPPIAAYFAAKTPSEIAATFAEDAVVVDERRLRRGRAEILKWREEVAQISFTKDVLSVAQADDRITVTCRVAGDFPGSPIDLDYVFRLSGNLISSLEIA